MSSRRKVPNLFKTSGATAATAATAAAPIAYITRKETSELQWYLLIVYLFRTDSRSSIKESQQAKMKWMNAIKTVKKKEKER